MNKVTYEIELTSANAPKIDAVNRILLGEDYTATPAKESSKPAAKTTTTKTETKPAKDSDGDADEMTLADFKAAVKAAKTANDEAFVKQVLADNGATEGPLGRMVSAIDVDDYPHVVALLEAGPTESEEDEDDDGLGDDDEDTSEVDVEAVKTAAKAYAKEVGRDEAKQIMNDNGAATLAKIADCNQKQLQAMFKAFTA